MSCFTVTKGLHDVSLRNFYFSNKKICCRGKSSIEGSDPFKILCNHCIFEEISFLLFLGAAHWLGVEWCWLMLLCWSMLGTFGYGGLPADPTPLEMWHYACHACPCGELTSWRTKPAAFTTALFINDEESPLSQQRACSTCPLQVVASANVVDAASSFFPFISSPGTLQTRPHGLLPISHKSRVCTLNDQICPTSSVWHLCPRLQPSPAVVLCTSLLLVNPTSLTPVGKYFPGCLKVYLKSDILTWRIESAHSMTLQAGKDKEQRNVNRQVPIYLKLYCFCAT